MKHSTFCIIEAGLSIACFVLLFIAVDPFFPLSLWTRKGMALAGAVGYQQIGRWAERRKGKEQ